MTHFITAFSASCPALVTFVTAGDCLTVIILANLCGRGDKDIFTVAEALGEGL